MLAREMTKRVEVMVFDGCPHLAAAVERAREAMAQADVPADLHVVRVTSDVEAKRLRFPGSPTVRVDGVDVEHAAQAREDYGMQCRVYAVEGRYQGVPPVEWIAAALRGDRRAEPDAEATRAG
jgi:hypothetical protein